MSFEIAEIDRRMAATVMAGVIESVDYENARCRVRVAGWVSAWLPWMASAAGRVRHWRPPSVGEQALIVSPSGEVETGFVMPGFYTDQHDQANDNRENMTATDYPDGAHQHYDHDNHEYFLKVPAAGRIFLQVGGSSLEMTDGTITLTTKLFKVNAPISVFEGNVDVAMSVHAGVNIIAANSVAALNGGVVLEAHQHTDVTSGDDKTGYPG